MDLDDLCAGFHEELDGRIIDVHLDELQPYSDRSTVRISFECDHFDAPNATSRLRFEIACTGVREMALTEWVVDSLAFLTEHPLLLEYNSPHEYLHFSSTPACPEEVIGRMYLAHQQVVGDWWPLSRVLNPSVGQAGLTLPTLLRAGRGMLAHGPSPVISALAEAVAPLMDVYRNPAYHPVGEYRVLLFGEAYVVCVAAEVLSVRAIADRLEQTDR